MPKKKVDKVDKLAKDLKLSDKERKSYVKLARQLKPKKVKDRIIQKTKAVQHFESGLNRIKNFKYDEIDPNTERPFRKDEGHPDGRFTPKEFDEWKENEIKTVENKIEYEKDKLKYWNTIKKFKGVVK